MIEPNWTLVFSNKRGRWWVRLLAWGRYHHVKAVAYLPAMRAWLFYDVKFNGTRLMLGREDDPGSRAFLRDYLDRCDLVAMPRLPVPKRVAPHAGFWCTLAMKHLVGIRTAALRPDRLWHDCLAVGGKPFENALGGSQPFESMLSFVKAHAQTSGDVVEQPKWSDDIALGRRRNELTEKLQARIYALRLKPATGGGKPPYSATASAPC